MLYTIDHEKIQELLDSFYEFFPVRFTLLNKEGLIFCSAGKQSAFCYSIANCKEFSASRRCLQDDIEAVEKSEKQGQAGVYVYRCHCGIINAVIPLRVGEDFIGYMMYGQFLSTDPINEQWQQTRKYLQNKVSSVDLETLRKQFCELPRHDDTRLLRFAKIIQTSIAGIQAEAVVNSLQMTDEDRLTAYIRTHYMDQLQLDDIARDLRISKSKLCSIAAKKGTTVVSMINDYRISLARQFLAHSNHPIEDIAFEVGIPNANYFSILFKKIVGVTPRQYQQEMRSAE